MVKIRFRPSIRELVSIARTDRTTRVGYSPFGDVGGTLYGAGAAPWKLVRKAPGEGLAEFLNRLRAINERVALGLANAIRVSAEQENVRQVAYVITTSGGLKVMPLKAARQSIGRPTEIKDAAGKVLRVKERVAQVLAQAPTYSGLLPGIRGIAPVTVGAL
jgi:hypothetical protein